MDDILASLFVPDLESNHPHSGDKRDAAAIAVPPAPDSPITGSDTDPNQRNLIAIAEDDYQEVIEGLVKSDSWRDRVEGHLAAMQLFLAKEYAQQEIMRFDTLGSSEYIVNRQGRRYFVVLSGGIVACQASSQGLTIPFTLRPGWNLLNFPDGTAITTITGTATVAIRLTNWLQPDDSLSTTVGKASTALSNPPANTNSGSDTTLTFATPVAHWTLQNNSAAAFNYNPDAAATAGSLVLAPGAQAFYDWPVSAVHVLTPSAIAVNGSGGLALVGRL